MTRSDGWPGVDFADFRSPPVQTYEQRIADTERDLNGLEGILSAEDMKTRQGHLDTVKLLHDSFKRGEEVVGILIEMGLQLTREGLDRPDRLATAYRIADKARSIEGMAVQLANAEALFESDISDSDLGDIESGLTRIEREMEFGE